VSGGCIGAVAAASDRAVTGVSAGVRDARPSDRLVVY